MGAPINWPFRTVEEAARAHLAPGRLFIGVNGREQLAAALVDGRAVTRRKKARIIAVQLDFPFAVETGQGIMDGEPGDWLVTNHPDDDPGSDIWPVSRERMAATYEEA
jgi:hypothetical protein